MNDFDSEWYKQYENTGGKRKAKGARQRKIAFSWEKLSAKQGQSIKDWEENKLLSQFCDVLKQISQYSAQETLAKKLIKQYTKVGFPPNSEFDEPTHVTPEYWAVIHIKNNSLEVVAGYIENDIFYIVFLDKEHKFWPTDIQGRGKNFR